MSSVTSTWSESTSLPPFFKVSSLLAVASEVSSPLDRLHTLSHRSSSFSAPCKRPPRPSHKMFERRSPLAPSASSSSSSSPTCPGVAAHSPTVSSSRSRLAVPTPKSGMTRVVAPPELPQLPSWRSRISIQRLSDTTGARKTLLQVRVPSEHTSLRSLNWKNLTFVSMQY